MIEGYDALQTIDFDTPLYKQTGLFKSISVSLFSSEVSNKKLSQGDIDWFGLSPIDQNQSLFRLLHVLSVDLIGRAILKAFFPSQNCMAGVPLCCGKDDCFYNLNILWDFVSLLHDVGMWSQNKGVIPDKLVLPFFREDADPDIFKWGCSSFSIDDLKSYYCYNFLLYKSYFGEKYEHGLLGACLIYNHRSLLTSLFNGNAGSDRSILSSRSRRFFEVVCSAIACHNIWPIDLSQKSKIIKELGWTEERLKLLASKTKSKRCLSGGYLNFLLCLCDTIDPLKNLWKQGERRGAIGQPIFLSKDENKSFINAFSEAFSIKNISDRVILQLNVSTLSLFSRSLDYRASFKKWSTSIEGLAKWLDVDLIKSANLLSIVLPNQFLTK